MRDQPAPFQLNIEGLRRHSVANRLAGLSILTVVILALIGLKGTVRRPESRPLNRTAAFHVALTVADRRNTPADVTERRELDREDRHERSCGF